MLIVLKMDGRTGVAHWNWLVLIVVPIVIAGAAAMMWLAIHYYSTLGMNCLGVTGCGVHCTELIACDVAADVVWC